MPDGDLLKIGRISGAAGLKGEVKLHHFSGEKERLLPLSCLFIGASERWYDVLTLRFQKNTPIFKLAGIDDRNAAEALIGDDVSALIGELSPTDEDEYFVSRLIGMPVYDEMGICVGRVKDIISNPAHDILEIVPAEGRAFLLPMVDNFVTSIDPVGGRIEVSMPDGITG